MEKLIPFFRPSIGQREIDEAVRVIKSGTLTLGKETRALEKDFAQFVGSRYAVAVDSCTSALFLSLKCNGIGTGDIVTIPSLTFASVANIIIHCGAKIEWEDESFVGRAYHLKNNRVFRVVDSAHQIERNVYQQFPGSLMCFSFYPTKQITSAEGGMIALNDHYAMEWLEKARWNGRKGWGPNYVIELAGWKMNMTDLQAVLARVQLYKLEAMNRRRKYLTEYYNRELGENVTSLHLYTIEEENRDAFINFMAKKNIQCSIHFATPLHLQPAYKEFKAFLPRTEALSKRTVSLPLYPDLDDTEAEYIVATVKEWRNAQGE